jgi:hypothetical protein
MADSKGITAVVIGGVIAGVFGLLTSSIWGPPICRAVGVCDEPLPPPRSVAPPTSAPIGPIDFTFPPNAETNIFLSETSGPAGSAFKVSGEGFQAGETVIITMSTTEIGRTTASPAGTFSSVEVTVPSKFGVFAPNQFYVTARGNASIRFATAPFTVSG